MDISAGGTIRDPNWDGDWWRGVCEAAEGPVCGALVREGVKTHVCMRLPETKSGRCAEHNKATRYFEEEVFELGLGGLRACTKECASKSDCEYYRDGFVQWKTPPYCFRELSLYRDIIKNLLGEIGDPTNFAKIGIQTIAMIQVQINRCDEEISRGPAVIVERQVFKSRDNERIIETPKENPAILLKGKLVKSLSEMSKNVMLSPKEKSASKKVVEAKSPAEFIADIIRRSKDDGGVSLITNVTGSQKS